MPEPSAGGPLAGDARLPPGERARAEAVVSGRVQGVGFRRYVRGWARKLGLAGWVRNEPDGTVRLVAEGAPAALDRLARVLWGGPPGARVEAVDLQRKGVDGQAPAESSFEIRR